MMANVDLMTLDPKGIISNPDIKLTTLLAHALVADNFQCRNQPGEVVSIPYIVASNNNNTSDMVSELESKLSRYFNKYFDKADVKVKESVRSEEEEYLLDLHISITVESNGKTYGMSDRLINTKDNNTLRLLGEWRGE